MTAFNVTYNLSSECSDRLFVETGNRVKRTGLRFNLEASALSVDQRRTLKDGRLHCDGGDSIVLRLEQDARIETVEQLFAAIDAEFSEFSRWVEEVNEKMRAQLSDPGLSNLSAPSLYCPRHYPNYRNHMADDVKALWDERAEKQDQEFAALKTRRQAEEVAAAAKQESLAAEKIEWVSKYGSDYLKDSVKLGYSQQRLYVTERANIEFPGFVVDFDDAYTTGTRSRPSVLSITLEKELAAKYPDVEISVVWVSDVSTDEYEEFLPEEAVMISNYLGKYYLLKFLGDPEADR